LMLKLKLAEEKQDEVPVIVMTNKNNFMFKAYMKLMMINNRVYLCSDEVPGLNIIGDDRATVISDGIQGIKFLFKQVHGVDVDVRMTI